MNESNEPLELRAATAVLLSLIVFFAACASVPVPQPVANATERLDLGRFSVLPPQGDRWFTVFSNRSGDDVAYLFAKQLDDSRPLGISETEAHTVRAQIRTSKGDFAGVGNYDEFLSRLKKLERDNTSARFTVIEESYTPFEMDGSYCAIVDKLQEDRGVPHDLQSVYIFRYTATYCHDTVSKLLVVAGCSQRAPSNEEMVDLSSDCDPFMKSVRFHRQGDKSATSGSTSLPPTRQAVQVDQAENSQSKSGFEGVWKGYLHNQSVSLTVEIYPDANSGYAGIFLLDGYRGCNSRLKGQLLSSRRLKYSVGGDCLGKGKLEMEKGSDDKVVVVYDWAVSGISTGHLTRVSRGYASSAASPCLTDPDCVESLNTEPVRNPKYDALKEGLLEVMLCILIWPLCGV